MHSSRIEHVNLLVYGPSTQALISSVPPASSTFFANAWVNPSRRLTNIVTVFFSSTVSSTTISSSSCFFFSVIFLVGSLDISSSSGVLSHAGANGCECHLDTDGTQRNIYFPPTARKPRTGVSVMRIIAPGRSSTCAGVRCGFFAALRQRSCRTRRPRCGITTCQ